MDLFLLQVKADSPLRIPGILRGVTPIDIFKSNGPIDMKSHTNDRESWYPVRNLSKTSMLQMCDHNKLELPHKG